MFSSSNNSFLGNIPPVTKNILIINLIVWGACFFLNQIPFAGIFGLYNVFSKHFYLYQLITYIFTHTQFLHLFFNMFALFMFGRVLENYWGSSRFLTYYLVTGLGAGLIQLLVLYIRIHPFYSLLSPELVREVYLNGAHLLAEGKNYFDPTMGKFNLLLNVPTIGASGAVFGILLAFGMIFPNVPLMIIPFPFPIKAKYLVIGYGLLELTMGVANRSGDNVAHFAHLGGMLFGIILILYWRKNDGNYLIKNRNISLLKKVTRFFKKKPKITIHKRPENDWDYNARKVEENKAIDRILEKIKYSGYDSLSENEKKILFDASNK